MRFKGWKDQNWFPYTVAAVVAVVFWFVLNHIGTIGHGIAGIFRVCIPIIGGIVIAYVVDPIVRFIRSVVFKKIQKEKIARGISIIITFILIIAAVAVLLINLLPQIIGSIRGIFIKLEIYQATLENWLATFEIPFDGLTAMLDKWLDELNNVLPSVISWLLESYQNIGSIVLNVFVSFVLAVYLLFGKDNAFGGVKNIFLSVLNKKQYDMFCLFCTRCNEILSKYITGSIIEALVVGLVNAILMSIFKMPYVVLVSVVVGITNLAPTFGPLIGGAIGFVLLFLEKPFYGLVFVIFTLGIQFVDGYIIKPRFFGGTLGVSSIWILIVIIVFGKLFGVVGVVLSIPTAAIIQILLRDFIRIKRRDVTETSE